jgi:hypothetical protein
MPAIHKGNAEDAKKIAGGIQLDRLAKSRNTSSSIGARGGVRACM